MMRILRLREFARRLMQRGRFIASAMHPIALRPFSLRRSTRFLKTLEIALTSSWTECWSHHANLAAEKILAVGIDCTPSLYHSLCCPRRCGHSLTTQKINVVYE